MVRLKSSCFLNGWDPSKSHYLLRQANLWPINHPSFNTSVLGQDLRPEGFAVTWLTWRRKNCIQMHVVQKDEIMPRLNKLHVARCGLVAGGDPLAVITEMRVWVHNCLHVDASSRLNHPGGPESLVELGPDRMVDPNRAINEISRLGRRNISRAQGSTGRLAFVSRRRPALATKMSVAIFARARTIW